MCPQKRDFLSPHLTSVLKKGASYHPTSIDALDDLGAFVVPVKVIDEAFEKLLQHKVDAVVFDSPAILYYPVMKGPETWPSLAGFLIFNIMDFCFPKEANSAKTSTGRY